MREPIATTIVYKKGKVRISKIEFVCYCNGVVYDVGSAGCSHDSDFTYFGQCEKCKSMFASDHNFEGNNREMDDAGWIRVK